MIRHQELELRLRAAFMAEALPPAPASLHDALDRAVDLPAETRARPTGGLGIVRALAVAAVVAAGGAVALSVGGGRFDAPEAVATPAPAPSESREPVIRLTFRPEWTEAAAATAGRLEAIVEIVAARLDAIGVEPVVSSDDNGNVVVEIPEDADPEAVRRIASQVGYVEFVPLGDRTAISGERLDDADNSALFDGEAITSATMTEEQAGVPSIRMTLRDAEATMFGEYTEANIGSFFAITIDRVVVLAPSIDVAIHGGEIAISPGNPDTERLVEAAAIIDNGPLPVPLVELALDTAVPSDSVMLPGSSAPITYGVRCGPLESAACEARAAEMVAEAREHSPDKAIILIEFLADGDTRVVYDDGSETMGIRN